MPTPPQSSSTDLPGCLVRSTWMLAGNFALALFTILIASGHSILGLADVGLWLSGGAVVVTRWLDVTRYAGTTAEGEPATLAHWKRHAVIIGVATFLLWIVAHAIAWVRVR